MRDVTTGPEAFRGELPLADDPTRGQPPNEAALLQGEELWRAVQAIEVESGGGELLEAIALQASRLAATSHAEVRFLTATAEERRACTGLGAERDLDDRPCCTLAARGCLRLPLRMGGLPLGELLIAEPIRQGGALRALRRFATLVSSRLEIERLRQEVALRAHEEARARHREERFAAALAHIPIILATQDRTLRHTWIHRPAGMREEEILGRTDLELHPNAEGARLHALKQRVLETGQPTQAEITLSAGGNRTWQVAVSPVLDPWGKITGVATAAVDVTARAREAGMRERLLLQREDERSWLLSVIERSPVGILLVETDQGGERITANRRAAELLGHPVDPHRARQVIAGRLLAPGGKPLSLEELPSSRALRGERVSMEEARVRRLDGTEVPIVVSAGPILDASGRQAGAVVTFDDISPFKELEQMRDQWTSLITHDLRQPITSIIGFASVLCDHPDLPAHLRSKVVHIVAAARRLGRMTADLLEASRLESNQLALERQSADVCRLVEEVIERLAVEMQDHPVRVEALGPVPLVHLDPERFEQVLGNLFSNAAKYSSPGSPVLVRVEHVDGEVVVGVTNEGMGLTPDELRTIFERYHRSDLARRSRIRGMGLGLYIARGLVEAHGGRIWAETEPGRNVTFRVALPVAPADGAS